MTKKQAKKEHKEHQEALKKAEKGKFGAMKKHLKDDEKKMAKWPKGNKCG